MTEVRMRDVPEQHVVSETKDVDQAALEAWLPGAMSRVATAAKEHGGPLTAVDRPELERYTADPVFVVIYEGNPNDGPVEVVVCAVVPDGGDRTLPAHREAYVRVTKGQVTTGQLGGVYPAIEKWISEQGRTVAAAPRETYWTDFFAAADDDEVFDVAFPVT